MATTQKQYIDLHIDDSDLCARFPDYKRRLHELERQFVAGKLRAKGAQGAEPTIGEVLGIADDESKAESKPKPKAKAKAASKSKPEAEAQDDEVEVQAEEPPGNKPSER